MILASPTWLMGGCCNDCGTLSADRWYYDAVGRWLCGPCGWTLAIDLMKAEDMLRRLAKPKEIA